MSLILGVIKYYRKEDTMVNPMETVRRGRSIALKGKLFALETLRRSIQILSLVLFNSAILGLSATAFVLPILLSSGSPFRVVDEVMSVMQKMIFDGIFPFLPLASVMIFGALTGRMLCGWACPLGLIQDVLVMGRAKKARIQFRTHRSLAGMKYAILGLILIISLSFSVARFSRGGWIYVEMMGVFAQAPFTTLSPSDTLLAVLPRLFTSIYSGFDITMITPLLAVRLTILVVTLLLAIHIPRAWCRYLCPQGALSAIVGRFSLLGLSRSPVRCIKVGCRICEEECPMMVPILKLPREKISDPDCIYCLRCVVVCPSKAIRPKFP